MSFKSAMALELIVFGASCDLLASLVFVFFLSLSGKTVPLCSVLLLLNSTGPPSILHDGCVWICKDQVLLFLLSFSAAAAAAAAAVAVAECAVQ